MIVIMSKDRKISVIAIIAIWLIIIKCVSVILRQIISK